MPPASKLDDALSGARTALEIVCQGATGCGLPGLEGAASVLLYVMNQLKKKKENEENCRALLKQITDLSVTLQSALDKVKQTSTADGDVPKQLGSSSQLKARIDRMAKELGRVNEQAKTLKNVSCMRKALKATPNSELLAEMAQSVRDARGHFVLEGVVTIEALILELKAKDQQDVREREQARAEKEWTDLLQRLPRANAGYTASVHHRHGRLLEGTRTELLRELDEWATCPPSAGHQSFYVLTGGAGTGKSTVAFEVAKRAESGGRLGASFFFMRGAASLDTTELMFPTLAGQLLTNVPGLRSPAAYSVIDEHLNRGGLQNMDQQAKDLFGRLLLTLPVSHPPIVIVVDAVDECSASTQDFVQRMLFLIMHWLSSITCPIRVLVTSRPEVHVEDALRSDTFESIMQRFRLHDIPRPTVDDDIRLFFENAVSQMPEACRLALSSVYGDAAGELTGRAAGLFIYAATAAEYLRSFTGDNILSGIAQILASDVDATNPELGRLDSLYTIVLNTAFPPEFLRATSHAQDAVNVVLGGIAVLQDHVSPNVLARFASLDVGGSVVPVLNRLASVISFDSDDLDAVMRPLHASFPEFLVDPRRRNSGSAFWVDASAQHCMFMSYSLHLLNRRGILVSNTCRLDHPEVTPISVPDLQERLSRYLPPSIQYACIYWPAHAANVAVTSIPEPLLEQLCFSERFVFWLEALGYLGRLGIATQWLPSLRSALADRNSKLAGVLHDGFNIVAEFEPAMRANPYQLYISALPFCPSDSPLRQYVPPHLSTVRVPVPRSSWSSWKETLLEGQPQDGERGTSPLGKSSPDGRWFAVLSEHNNGKIHFCDPATSNLIRTIIAHPSQIRHMDVSSSGRTMVTVGGRCDVSVTDCRSGSRLHSFPGSTPATEIRLVAYALRDTAVVLVSREDILLWDLRTKTHRSLSGAEGTKHHLSPHLTRSNDGSWAILASGHRAELLDLRECTAHVFLEVPTSGSELISGAGFLPGDRVLLAFTESLRTYDLHTGRLLCSVAHAHLLAMSLSLDTRMIALGGHGVHAVAWDYSSTEPVTTRLSDQFVMSLGITPTGTYIMTLSGNQCRVIDTREGAPGRYRGDGILDTAVSGDLTTVVVRGGYITSYRIEDGVRKALTSMSRSDSNNPSRGMALSHDARTLMGIWCHSIQLWNGSWSEAFTCDYFEPPQGHSGFEFRTAACKDARKHLTHLIPLCLYSRTLPSSCFTLPLTLHDEDTIVLSVLRDQ